MIGKMLGSNSQVATFLIITVVQTTKLQHFSSKMPHAVANIKKYAFTFKNACNVTVHAHKL